MRYNSKSAQFLQKVAHDSVMRDLLAEYKQAKAGGCIFPIERHIPFRGMFRIEELGRVYESNSGPSRLAFGWLGDYAPELFANGR